MLSKFKNLFLRSDRDEKNAFRNRVLEIVRVKFPEVEFSPGDEVELINYAFEPGDIRGQLGLTNIYAAYLQTARTSSDLQECVESTFGGLRQILQNLDVEFSDSSWSDVKSMVLPQLMPREYADDLEVVSRGFGDDVMIGFVIDGEQSYSYITTKALDGWEVPVSELHEQALANLMERSEELEFTFAPEPNAMIVLDTMDGFDATRIIVPEIREFLAEKLGATFRFGVPNRDFLVCWSSSNDASFHEQMRRQIADDFAEQPYSLSGAVFEMRPDGEIVLIRS